MEDTNGKFINSIGDVFQGCIVNSRKDGKGQINYYNGDIYLGDF